MEDIYKQLKTSQKVIGTKQVMRGISEGTVRCVIVAKDADKPVKDKITAAASQKGVSVLTVPSKAELGKAVEIDVAAAVVGLTVRDGEAK